MLDGNALKVGARVSYIPGINEKVCTSYTDSHDSYLLPATCYLLFPTFISPTSD